MDFPEGPSDLRQLLHNDVDHKIAAKVKNPLQLVQVQLLIMMFVATNFRTRLKRTDKSAMIWQPLQLLNNDVDRDYRKVMIQLELHQIEDTECLMC